MLPALLTDAVRLAAMGQAARGLMRSDADDAVAAMMLAAVRP